MKPPAQDDGSWIELAAKLDQTQMARDHFVRDEDNDAVAAWRREHHNTDVYASICHFVSPDRGRVASCPFFLDIDAPDRLEEGRDQTLKACQLLHKRIGVGPDSFDLFFSGAKGFHLIIPPAVFGDTDASGLMPIWDHLARRLVKEELTHIDLGVYQTSRLLRLPNSINSKTGLHKIAVEFKELQDLSTADILDLAKAPREFESMAVPAESDRAIAWLAEAKRWFARYRRQFQAQQAHALERGWRMPPCIRRIETTVLPDGVRHQVYYTLARFYAMTGMAESEALERLQEIDHRHPIRDPDYLARVVRNARTNPGLPRCPAPGLEPYCGGTTCFLRPSQRSQGGVA